MTNTEWIRTNYQDAHAGARYYCRILFEMLLVFGVKNLDHEQNDSRGSLTVTWRRKDES